jgi:glycosyltransferase involved in cell wall biosynthesis
MERNFPLVSIIIPCRNERRYIAKCLDSIIAQDYPKEKLEVLVADGMSDDGTRKIISNYCRKFPFVKLLNNPKKFTPFALNIGIKNSVGETIIRMDAHAEYAPDYISQCAAAARQSGVENVGGRSVLSPRDDSLTARAIVAVLSSFFGAGDATYKTKIAQKPIEVDTVFGGCFKRGVFDKVGLFDERMIRNQDLEFNLRLRRAGGKIVLFPEIVSYYFPKKSLRDFARHNFADGFWVIYPLKFGLKTFSWRHFLPMVFVLAVFFLGLSGFFNRSFWLLLALLFSTYFLLNLSFSVKIAYEKKSRLIFVPMSIAFFVRHFFYGLGSFAALIKVLFSKFYF